MHDDLPADSAPAFDPSLPPDFAELQSGVPLGEPWAEFVPPPFHEDPVFEKSYFDPEGWDAQFTAWAGADKHDPVAADRGKLAGAARAALLVSDLHLGDGSAGGDDFLDSHILPDEALGVHTGFAPGGESRAKVFASVLSFALDRIAKQVGASTRLDVVLAGDVVNVLELKGRGSTLVSPKHKALFRTLAAARAVADVYWLRGNHDYVLPTGPWQSGEFYVNSQLQTLAEHGDFWDKECWPPGPENKASRLVIEAAAAFEALATIERDGGIKYLMSGVDNLRPWSDAAIRGFLDRRSKFSDVALMAAVLARLRYLGAADDDSGYQGALARRKKLYRDWLIVQGHTHVPAFVPGVYYNTGSWIATLVAKDGKECHIEAFPFVLIYLDGEGRRREEYFTVRNAEPGRVGQITLETKQSIDELRQTYGYEKPIP